MASSELPKRFRKQPEELDPRRDHEVINVGSPYTATAQTHPDPLPYGPISRGNYEALRGNEKLREYLPPLEPLEPVKQVRVQLTEKATAMVNPDIESETLEALKTLAEEAEKKAQGELVAVLQTSGKPLNWDGSERVQELVKNDQRKKARILSGMLNPMLGALVMDSKPQLPAYSGTDESPEANAKWGVLERIGNPNPEKVSVTPGMTLEQADSVGGLKGRIVWSLLHLGRSPLVTTVYHTAQLHPLVKDKWDTSEAFGEAVQSLTDDKVCYIVKPDRISLYNDSSAYAYKVVCSIPGCKVEAPSSSNKEAARDRAVASGFRFFTEEGKAEMAVCPAGNYLHNNIRDRIDGKSPSRADRRRLEKMQAKQARRSNTPL